MTTVLQVSVLIIVYLLYVICGGSIFMAIEQNNEIRLQLQLREALLQLTNGTCMDEAMLVSVLRTLGGARAEQACFLLETNQTQDIWALERAISFATTVVTTIGYGDRPPKTQGGRAFCVFYGIVGIPMTLVMLRHIGEGLRELMERPMRKSRIRTIRENPAVRAGLVALVGVVGVWLVPSAFYMLVVDWTYVDAIYFTFITHSTIGFGDLLMPAEAAFTAFSTIHLFIGLSFASLTVSCIANSVNDNFNTIDISHLQDEVERLKRELHRHGQRPSHGSRNPAMTTLECHSAPERNGGESTSSPPCVSAEGPEISFII